MIPQPEKFVRLGEVMSTIAPQQLGISLADDVLPVILRTEFKIAESA